MHLICNQTTNKLKFCILIQNFPQHQTRLAAESEQSLLVWHSDRFLFPSDISKCISQCNALRYPFLMLSKQYEMHFLSRDVTQMYWGNEEIIIMYSGKAEGW